MGSAAWYSGYSGTEPDRSVSLGQMTRTAVGELESRIILDSLHANQWNRKRTARALKISYRSLLYKLKKVGIQNRRDLAPAQAGKSRLEKLS